MANYLFPVQIKDGEVKLLPYVASEIPNTYTFTSSDNIPSEVETVLEKLHPNEEFDDFCEIIDALQPDTGILVHEFLSRPHSVIGYHKDMSEVQSRKIINEIEDRLGYELEQTDELESLSSDEIENHVPKLAGWDRNEDLVA